MVQELRLVQALVSLLVLELAVEVEVEVSRGRVRRLVWALALDGFVGRESTQVTNGDASILDHCTVTQDEPCD